MTAMCISMREMGSAQHRDVAYTISKIILGTGHALWKVVFQVMQPPQLYPGIPRSIRALQQIISPNSSLDHVCADRAVADVQIGRRG